MSYIQLRDLRSGDELEFEADAVRIGRSPDLEFVPSGPGSEVVSAHHAVLSFERGQWWIEDLESRNGTYLNDRVLSPGVKHPVERGAVLGFGSGGPRLGVEATEAREVAETLMEVTPGLDADATLPMVPPEAGAAPAPAAGDSSASVPSKIKLKLRETRDGREFKVSGGRIRLGRGAECEVRPLREGDTLVSRVHAEISLSPDGRALLRDAQSRNGTFVNNRPLSGQHELREGDEIELGHGGPMLVVDVLVLPQIHEPAPAVPAAPSSETPTRRSFGGKGRTMFMRELVDETAKKSSARIRRVVFVAVVALGGAVAAVYWYSERRVRETAQALEETTAALAEQQARADSLRIEAETDRERLRAELAEARRTSAPASVVDSLRDALDSATARTEALEASLQRAQRELTGQIAAAESLRTAREGEVARLSAELASAAQSQVSQELLDSLRQAVRDAEEQADALDIQLRAVRGVNLAAVAQANQASVGLVSAYVNAQLFSGSGFVVSTSGYFITNRHVVVHNGQRADSIFVTMADHQQRRPASVVRISIPPGPDLAVLQIAQYDGPYIGAVDWSGARVSQGEPAALIGFPSGFGVALDLSATVRTSMTAGIFSKVTEDLIQFDGFTVGGSSGSPIFNADGEVVAVHRAGLAEAAGLAFAIPIPLVIPLLPQDLLTELNLTGG